MIPEFPPQSPARVGEPPAAVPAIVISRKSQSSADRVPTVRVRVVPMVLESSITRLTAEAPAAVSVPVMVWSSPTEHWIKPSDVGAVTVKLVNVFAPVIVFIADDVPVNVTL